MRRFAGILIITSALASLSLATQPSSAQPSGAEAIAVRTTPLRGGVSMLRGRGGNLAVSVGEDGVLVVDSDYANVSDAILQAIDALAAGRPRFLIDTHWHGDHAGGNARLAADGGIVMAHDAVRARMSSEQYLAAFDLRVPPSPEAARPILTYSDTLTLHWNGGAIRVLHVPHAHTDGDSLVLFEAANVLHTGDVYFEGSFPFIDLSSGGSLAGMVEAGERALSLCDAETQIIPGHGPLADRADLAAYVKMLATVHDRLQDFAAHGLSIDEVLARRPTREFEASRSAGALSAERFLRIVYEEAPANK